MSRPMAFKVVRNFGHTISNLHVHISSLFCGARLVSHLNEYCDESMEELSFHGCDLSLSNMKKSFRNLKTFKTLGCILFDKPATIGAKLFPNLKHLKLKDSGFKAPPIVHHMPQLVRFSFTPERNNDHLMIKTRMKIVVDENNIIELLKANPQIEILQLHLLENHGLRVLQYVSKHLQSLRKLNLTIHDVTLLENTQELLTFDNVEDFHLLVHKCAKLSRNPFVFKNLKSITTSKFDFDEMTLIDFFDKNKSISTVVINRGFMKLNVTLKNFLQNVEQFGLCFIHNVLIEKILEIIQQNFRLKRFFIGVQTAESYRAICDSIRLRGVDFKEKTKHLMRNGRFSSYNVTVKVLELFARNSPNSLITLEYFDRGSENSALRWYSDTSELLRLRKSIHLMFDWH